MPRSLLTCPPLMLEPWLQRPHQLVLLWEASLELVLDWGRKRMLTLLPLLALIPILFSLLSFCITITVKGEFASVVMNDNSEHKTLNLQLAARSIPLLKTNLQNGIEYIMIIINMDE